MSHRKKPWQIATPTYGYEDKSFDSDRRRSEPEERRYESDGSDAVQAAIKAEFPGVGEVTLFQAREVIYELERHGWKLTRQ